MVVGVGSINVDRQCVRRRKGKTASSREVRCCRPRSMLVRVSLFRRPQVMPFRPCSPPCHQPTSNDSPQRDFPRRAVSDTAEAITLIERERPNLVAVGWDDEPFAGQEICKVARRRLGTGILATMTVPELAPSALKAGCHAILLKPLTIDLIAARLMATARIADRSPDGAHRKDVRTGRD